MSNRGKSFNDTKDGVSLCFKIFHFGAEMKVTDRFWLLEGGIEIEETAGNLTNGKPMVGFMTEKALDLSNIRKSMVFQQGWLIMR